MFGSTGTSGPSSGNIFGTAGSSNNDKPSMGPSIFGNTQSSGFSFGQPPAASSGGNNDKKDAATSSSNFFGGGAFGQAASGNAGGSSDAQKPTTSLFGNTGTTSSTPKPLFGQSSTTGNDGKSMFGQQPASSGSGGGGIFGKQDTSSKPAGGFFGTGASSQTPGTPSQSSAPKINFGSTTPAPAGNSNFLGGSSTTPAGQPPTLMFGASTGGASSQAQSQPSTQAPSIGQAPISTQSTKPTMFGAAGTSSLFGAKPAENTTQPTSSFGGFKLGQPSDKPAEPAATKPDVPKFSFPSNAPASSAPATPSIFGPTKPAENTAGSTPAQPAVSKPAGFSFQTTSSGSTQAQTATTKPPAFSGFNLGASAADKSSLFPAAATPSTQAAEQPKQSGPLFPSLGNPQSTTATSQPATTAPASTSLFPSFGAKTPASTATTTSATAAPASTSNFFGAPPAISAQTSSTTPAATTAPAAASTKPTFGASTPAAPGTSTLGASTAGPAAPAQSRLRNRTMDEILTRWASDLTRYTKEFKGHAEQVAYWDQIIVDNSAKIDKLYVKTRTCEKQTMSVEMQLSAVENQQNELESWLSKYEGDVEEMLTKDGSGQNEPGGPDQERERTYQLAERLGERLDDMGRDLQSMIEEVNAANAGLGKSSKMDEPITQIVKILNAHLSQLQAIDQGTAALQAKVSAAQKAASGMNYLNASMNGDNRGAVDDFYRSYMGRR